MPINHVISRDEANFCTQLRGRFVPRDDVKGSDDENIDAYFNKSIQSKRLCLIYFVINFWVVFPTLTKYIPLGKVVTSISEVEF